MYALSTHTDHIYFLTVTEKVWEDVSTDASETEQPPPKKPQEKVTKSPQVVTK